MASYKWKWFLIDDNEDEFHELIHCWHHLGTAYGAFRIIGHLITVKAMRKSIAYLRGKDLLHMPICQELIDTIGQNENGRFLRMAFEYQEKIRKYEGGIHPMTPRFELPSVQGIAHSDSDDIPIFPVCEKHGYALGAEILSELHVHVIDKLRHRGAMGEYPFNVEISQRIENLFNCPAISLLPALISWSLDVPGPQHNELSFKDRQPGWRFVKAVELLLERKEEIKMCLARNSEPEEELLSLLAAELPHADDKDFEYFQSFCERHAQWKPDAQANQDSYAAFAELFRKVRSLNKKAPLALTRPDLYENELRHHLESFGKLKDHRFLFAPKAEGWYSEHLKRATLAWQFFNNASVECIYRFFDAKMSCRQYRDAVDTELECLVLSADKNKSYLDCEFYQFCKDYGVLDIE